MFVMTVVGHSQAQVAPVDAAGAPGVRASIAQEYWVFHHMDDHLVVAETADGALELVYPPPGSRTVYATRNGPKLSVVDPRFHNGPIAWMPHGEGLWALSLAPNQLSIWKSEKGLFLGRLAGASARLESAARRLTSAQVTDLLRRERPEVTATKAEFDRWRLVSRQASGVSQVGWRLRDAQRNREQAAKWRIRATEARTEEGRRRRLATAEDRDRSAKAAAREAAALIREFQLPQLATEAAATALKARLRAERDALAPRVHGWPEADRIDRALARVAGGR